MSEKKGRIEFVDLAKGFSILVVVFYHVFITCDASFFFNDLITKIMIPPFYVLSGMFFKKYEGFVGFTLRKINKLLIPFMFFYLFLTVPYTMAKLWNSGMSLSSIVYTSVFGLYFKDFINGKTWFLFSLFVTSLLFYFIYVISEKFKEYKVPAMIILSLAVGFTGVFLGQSFTDLPAYIDSSLSAIPLYCFGYLLNKHSNVLRANKMDKYNILIIIIILVGLYYIPGKCQFVTNHYYLHFSLIYPCCCLGALSIILLAKVIKSIRWFNYIGKYTIILLLLHEPVYVLVLKVLNYLGIDNAYTKALICLVITMGILTLLIPVCVRWLPYVTAQKDLIKVSRYVDVSNKSNS